jgi:4-hydroxy-4-methyl-2-oxoglutarate aldolase
VIAGQVIRPGDVVVADDDGVVVVPLDSVAETLAACEAREVKEAATRAAFQTGELGLDRYGLRPLLEHLGVEYVSYADLTDPDRR